MIKKLADLKISETFVQIDFIKGYKYIDKAGELINEFYKKDEEPSFSMDLNGLVIKEPEQYISEIKISPKMYWAHFIEPDSLDLVVDSFYNKYKVVKNILDVKNITRVGWRTFFAKEFKTVTERDDIIKKIYSIKNIKFEGGVFSLNKEDYSSRIRVSSATKNDDNKTPSIVFDFDLYKKIKDKKDDIDIKSILNYFKKELRSDFWVEIINNFINKENNV